MTEKDLEHFSKLSELFDAASSSVGSVIKLRTLLKEEGFKEIRSTCVTTVQFALGGSTHPRVVIGYATLLWFTEQV